MLMSTVSWADASNHVRDVKLTAEAGKGATEIEVVGTASSTYTLRVVDGGKRLFLDIQNADVTGAPAAITEATGVVGGVLTQSFKGDGGTQMTRVAVSLLKPAAYRVRQDGATLRLSLTPSDATAPAQGAAAAPKSEAELQSVRFDRDTKACTGACDKVIVQLSKSASYSIASANGDKLRLELKKTRVGDGVNRAIDLASHKGLLRTIATRYDADRDVTIVEIERDGDAQGSLSVEDGTLVWAFETPKSALVAAKKPDPKQPSLAQRKTVTVAREQAIKDLPKVETSIVGDDGASGEIKVETVGGGGQAGFVTGVSAQVGRYNGRRIDLDLKDADIHNILRLLADVGRVNIVTADDVSGTITIRMKNVPWDQALDVVLQAKGLGMVRSGNLIRVAPLSQLQKERELRLAAAKQEYELTPLETRLIPVSYATADELQARAKDLLSPRGSIAVDERTNVLIARDISGNLNNIEELIRSLDTQTPQVLIEARIVEATSRYQRDLGIQWGGDATFSSATGNPTGIAFPSRVTTAGGGYDAQAPTAGVSPTIETVPVPNFAVNLPAAVGTGRGGAIGFSLGSIDNNFNVNVRLSAAEASGLLRIVSSPRILTLDNRDARINQGTLLPFAQISAQGVQTTFQEAKLQLLVKPHVTADGAVAMHVKINRDEPDFNQTSPRGDPTILKREAETDLLVMDGHTAVIGGIYTRNTGRNIDQVPFFGDIPILGILFQRRRASDTRNELVIFLTPRIVNRAEALGR
ncbi:MAG: type IV pilus secretin PilQ [Myxococcales bacterium]|nr:type IV pilus secretin PilQ [Myxococcales bacterium]